MSGQAVRYILKQFIFCVKSISEIVTRSTFSTDDLVALLSSKGAEREILYAKARQVKESQTGRKIFFRGLIEISNICSKNCLYCGIRSSNPNVVRYDIPDEEILDVCRFAYEKRFGSVVLQSGEIQTKKFTKRIGRLLKKIKQLSNNELGITLSCGEQSRETYRHWFESGAHRYLLRIESTNRELYYKIHPDTPRHSYEKRVEALGILKDTGYQVGTGVMIGLPFQTVENLANDLQFFKIIDIDMCGMGPYIEHEHTPLYASRNLLKSKQERFNLSLNMISTLRLLMPDINIAAATALQTLDPLGREKALTVGANVIMPNLTPLKYRKEYLLYENKPCLDEDSEYAMQILEERLISAGCEIGYGEWGDSKRFINRLKK